jgi:hypothetical protein
MPRGIQVIQVILQDKLRGYFIDVRRAVGVLDTAFDENGLRHLRCKAFVPVHDIDTEIAAQRVPIFFYFLTLHALFSVGPERYTEDEQPYLATAEKPLEPPEAVASTDPAHHIEGECDCVRFVADGDSNADVSDVETDHHGHG